MGKLSLSQIVGKKGAEKREKLSFHSPAYRIKVVKDFCHLWSEYFHCFSEGLRERKIYESDEQAFFKIMTELSLKHYAFEQMAGEYFNDAEKILDVLCDAVSLSNLKMMSEAQFSKLEVDWHSVFIAINKCLGKLIGLLPPAKAEKITT